MKKKVSIAVISVLVLLCVVHGILTLTGWYEEAVEISGPGFTAGWDSSYAETEDDNTDHKEVSIANYFRMFEGLSMYYKVNAVMHEGTADLVVYDVTEEFETFTSGERRQTEGLTIAYSETITENGIHKVDLSNLRKDRIYMITVFENEGSNFTMELQSYYTIQRWMYLHDKYLTILPLIEPTYDPNEVF